MALAWTRRPLWTALAAAPLGGVLAAGIAPPTLGAGGMLLLAGAASVGLVVGLPVALAEARNPADPARPLGVATDAVGEVWSTVAVAAIAAPMVSALGWTGFLLAALAWAAAAFGGVAVRLGAGVLLLAALVLGGAGAGLAGAQGIGWSLLEPWWPAWATWLPLAVVGGFLLSGAGLGFWPREESAGPRAPVLAWGIGVLLLVVVGLRLAAPYEVGRLDALDPIALALDSVLAVAATLTVGMRPGARPLRAALGLVATALLAGPAAEALPLWWTVVLPLGLCASLGLRALRTRGMDAALLGLGAAVAGLAAVALPVVARPELPGPLAAAVLALVPVLAVWIGGTRALLVRST